MIHNTYSHVALICSWCQLVMREGQGPASHSICTKCQTEHFPEFYTPRTVALFKETV